MTGKSKRTFWIWLLVALLCLSGCGRTGVPETVSLSPTDSPQAVSVPSDDNQVTADRTIPEEEVFLGQEESLSDDMTALPVGADLGSYHVEMVGATATDDSLLYVFYTFSNHSDTLTSALLHAVPSATQNGAELPECYELEESVPGFDCNDLGVLPGCTAGCLAVFRFEPSEGPVTVRVQDVWDSGEILTAVLDLSDLPETPEATFSPEPQLTPDRVNGLGMAGEDIKIVFYEFSQQDDGQTLLLLHMDYENHSDGADSFYLSASVEVLQDGIELRPVPTQDDAEKRREVMPGESVHVTDCYLLRSYSPITVRITEERTGECLGLLIPMT